MDQTHNKEHITEGLKTVCRELAENENTDTKKRGDLYNNTTQTTALYIIPQLDTHPPCIIQHITYNRAS